MHRIIFSERASADLDRLRAFLARRSPRAAQRAVQRIIQDIDLLALFPRAGVAIDAEVRSLSISFGRSGYVVRYSIDGDAVIVARIWHGKEDRPR